MSKAMTAYTLQGPFEITFRHFRDSGAPFATECYIRGGSYNTTGEGCYGFGSADCHPGDNFDKEQGRKIALKRAIKNFTRTDRREFWRAYFDRLSIS